MSTKGDAKMGPDGKPMRSRDLPGSSGGKSSIAHAEKDELRHSINRHFNLAAKKESKGPQDTALTKGRHPLIANYGPHLRDGAPLTQVEGSRQQPDQDAYDPASPAFGDVGHSTNQYHPSAIYGQQQIVSTLNSIQSLLAQQQTMI
jgi:hypothetical protein